MDFLAGKYDVICTEKLIVTEAIAEVIVNFSVHITSYLPAKKSISVILVVNSFFMTY
jgi:hypothetical protein